MGRSTRSFSIRYFSWAVFLLALAGFASGCIHLRSTKYRTYPNNPLQDIKTVAVFPFVNETGVAVDGMEFAQIFSSELAKFPGFKVIRPNMVAAHAMESNATLETIPDILKFGKMIKADAVVIASVTDFDPYRPPRIGLSVQMFRVERSASARDISTMVQSATWSHRPMAIRNEDASYVVAATEQIYDSHNVDVHDEVIAYADAQQEDDYAFVSGSEFLAITSRYMQFVSNQMLNHVFELQKKKP